MTQSLVPEGSLLRAIVSKRVIDRLIRDKMRLVGQCGGVSAMPIVWRRRLGAECNWEIPGWIGEAHAVSICAAQISAFVRSLEAQFDIADEV